MRGRGRAHLDALGPLHLPVDDGEGLVEAEQPRPLVAARGVGRGEEDELVQRHGTHLDLRAEEALVETLDHRGEPDGLALLEDLL